MEFSARALPLDHGQRVASLRRIALAAATRLIPAPRFWTLEPTEGEPAARVSGRTRGPGQLRVGLSVQRVFSSSYYDPDGAWTINPFHELPLKGWRLRLTLAALRGSILGNPWGRGDWDASARRELEAFVTPRWIAARVAEAVAETPEGTMKPWIPHEDLEIEIEIPQALRPTERGARYEDPIEAMLAVEGQASVSGGASAIDDDEIRAVSVFVSLEDPDQAEGIVAQLRRQLRELQAPAGTRIRYSRRGERIELPL